MVRRSGFFQISYFAVFIIFFLLLIPTVSADKVYLTNGNKLEGNISAEKENFITLQVEGGSLKLYRSEIQRIEKGPLTSTKITQPSIVTAQTAASPQPPKKENFFENLKTQVQAKLDQMNPKKEARRSSSLGTRLEDLQKMTMKDWGVVIVKQAFGSEYVDKLNRAYLSRMAFIFTIVFIFWAFIIKLFVKILGSQSTLFTAFMFQAKTACLGLVMVLFIKGAIPAILFMLFPRLNQFLFYIEIAAKILSFAAIVSTFFHFSKKELDLSIIRSVALCVLSVGAGYVLHYIIHTYVF